MQLKASVGLVALLASAASVFSALAQSPVTPELSFVRSFIGMCVRYFPDIEKVKQTASALKWSEIKNPDVKGMLGPSDAGARWQGWLMKADGHAFLIGISEGVLDGARVKSCSLAADRIDLPSAYSTLERLVSLQKQLDFNEDGQRNQLWVYARDAVRFVVMATDGSPMKMNALSLSITNAQPRGR
jgi:hypothetical protein